MTDQLLRMIFAASLSLSLFILIWAQTKVWCFTAKSEKPELFETTTHLWNRFQWVVLQCLAGSKEPFLGWTETKVLCITTAKNFQAYLRQRSNSSLTISSLKFFFCHPLPLVAIVDGIPIIVIGPWPWFVMVCVRENKNKVCVISDFPCSHLAHTYACFDYSLWSSSWMISQVE
jgi:hypothetical protein